MHAVTKTHAYVDTLRTAYVTKLDLFSAGHIFKYAMSVYVYRAVDMCPLADTGR